MAIFGLASYVDGLAVYDGAKWGALTTANSGLRVDGITSVAFDEGGRLWAGTVYGLHVFDGKEWSIYDMDSAEINANQFSSIAIVGRGPELPLPIDRANGTLIGSIMRDNVAYANARIEICPLAVFFNYYGATLAPTSPCSTKQRQTPTARSRLRIFQLATTF